MQLNITTDYAIRTVLFLATKGELTSSNEIANAMGIPPHYILKVTNKLARGGIIKRFRGVKGGFIMGKATKDISLYDIVNIFEPTMKINRCLEDDEHCSRFAVNYCPVRCVYTLMQKNWEKMLHSVNVDALLKLDVDKSSYEHLKNFNWDGLVQLLQEKLAVS